MVERPIKKSERQSQNSVESNGDPASAQPEQSSQNETRERETPKPRPANRSAEGDSSKRSSDSRGGSKDRRRKDKDAAPAQAINPALVRGPKPVKPPVVSPKQSEEESVESIEDSPA